MKQSVYRPASASAVDASLEQRSPSLMLAVFQMAKNLSAAATGTDFVQLIRMLQRECSRLVSSSPSLPPVYCRVALAQPSAQSPQLTFRLSSSCWSLTSDSAADVDDKSPLIIPSGRGLVGASFVQSAIVSSTNPTQDPRFCADVDEDASLGGRRVSHLMCVPIIAPSVGLVGVIVLQQLFAADQPNAASQFTEDYQAALYSLGEFVAASLRNGALLEQTTSAFAASRDANNRIEIMLGIAKALMSEHRLSVLVSRIISEVPELLECDRCTLFFCNRNTNELIVTKGSSYGRRTSSMLNPALLESNRKSSGGSSGNLNLTPSSPSPLTPSTAAAGSSTPSTPSASSEEPESAAGGALPFGEATEVRMPMDRGVAGFVATTGSTLNIPDAYADERFNPAMDQKTGFRTRNILCVPMQDANGDIIGVIQTLNKKERAFDASDEMILRMFAAHAAVAVKNSRLFAEAQRALRKSDALLEVTNAITREMDLPPLINVIVNKTQLLLTAERCTVWLVDDEKEERELWSTASMSCGVGAPLPINTNVEVIMRIPSNRGIAGHVASTGQLVNLEDAYTDSRFNQQMDKTSGFRTRALLCIPIFSQGNSPSTPRSSSSEAPSGAKVLGVIQALNKKLGGMFTDEDVRMMQAFAAQAAVAIAKHKLHHETRKALNQALREQRNLKFLLTFSRNLCAELQTANVAQQLQRQVCDLLNADGVHIFMVDTEEEVSGTMMVRVTDDDAPVPSDPWQSMFPAGGQRMRFPAPKGLMCNVLQSGVGALYRSNVHLEPGFDADSDSRIGRPRPNSLLIMPVVFDPERKAALEASKTRSTKSIPHQNKSPMTSAPNSTRSSLRVPTQPASPAHSVSPALSASPARASSMRGTAGSSMNAHQIADARLRHEADQRQRDQLEAAAAADPEIVLAAQAAVALPPSCKVICVVVAILDSEFNDPSDPTAAPASRSFGPDDQRMLASLCGQAAFSLVKAQQLTKLVEDVGKEPSTAAAAASGSTRSSTSAINRTEDSEDIVDDNIEAFQFKFSEINFVRNIGSGSYGEVFKARLRGMTVAVKRINARGLRAEHVDAFCSEASLMCQLRHRNCVRFIGAVAEPPELCIITEFCQHGALSDLLLQQTVEMDFKLKLKCCLDAARGMEYMHSCNPVILHRDLKSDNLLVTSDWTVKVADFGLSRFRSDKKTMSQVGTPMWMAPEVILGEKYTEKADVYSFGVILWEIMTRKEPYEDKEAMQIVLEVVNKGLRPKIPPHYFDCPLVPLMRDCWEEDPKKRPVFSIICDRLTAIQHAYGDSTKWH